MSQLTDIIAYSHEEIVKAALAEMIANGEITPEEAKEFAVEEGVEI